MKSKSLVYLSCPIFVNNVRKTPLSKVKSWTSVGCKGFWYGIN